MPTALIHLLPSERGECAETDTRRWEKGSDLKAKRKSGSVKFLSNEKIYTLLSLFLWVEGGDEV